MILTELSNKPLKVFSTIGCCGIDCGLCPRYFTKGDSACPGCGGPDFQTKHPTCGFVTCCVTRHELEVCSNCESFPCSRFDKEKEGYDSFVTHKKTLENLEFIKKNSLNTFIIQQKTRIYILKDFLENYDDSRSKSFFCISCALLPSDKLMDAQRFAKSLSDSISVREKNKLLKDYLKKVAENLKIELKLKNK
jgi:hypothetical protein